jgi:hypothetical protein
VWELGEKLKLKLQISKSWIIDVMTNIKKRRGKLSWHGKGIKRGMMMRAGVNIGVARRNMKSP